MVIAPSAPGDQMQGADFARAAARLETLGVECVPSPSLRAGNDGLAVPPDIRLADFQAALDDPDIDMMIALYGGYNAIDLLAWLPYRQWSQTGKPLIGFSDITALHLAGWTQAGIPGLLGPNLSNLAGPDMDRYTLDQLACVLRGGPCQVSPPDRIAEDIWYAPGARAARDWRRHQAAPLRRGVAEGPLLGGNLSTLLGLAGTPFFPDFTGALLFLEANTGIPIGSIDRDLAQLRALKVFDKVQGVAFGALGYQNEPHMERLVEKHLGDFKGPIATGVAASHVDPIATLVIGAHTQLDTETAALTFTAPTLPITRHE